MLYLEDNKMMLGYLVKSVLKKRISQDRAGQMLLLQLHIEAYRKIFKEILKAMTAKNAKS